MKIALDLSNETPLDADDLTDGITIAALRQSILHTAFTGRLVPQDPTEEPASALLAHLRNTASPARRMRGSNSTKVPA